MTLGGSTPFGDVVVGEESIAGLAEYSGISITFTVSSELRAAQVSGGFGGIVLTEHAVSPPYEKDYDAIDDEGPTRWARRFDLTNWGLLAARVEGELLGGAVIAFDTPDVWMLEGRQDQAVLWDLRVRPGSRRRAVGRRLFDASVAWATRRQCRSLVIETQNVNVAACRFYAAMGCELRRIDRFAYPDLPDEVQLLWRRRL
jgi:ribosomal protein S18 acetylase RimI-like enzyme